jgi:hypothetical protein
MKKYAHISLFGVLLALIFHPSLVEAQCAMCRAVTESNQNSDDAFTVGNGLNSAILYLMAMPYILAVIFFYAFFRKQITAWFKRTFLAH